MVGFRKMKSDRPIWIVGFRMGEGRRDMTFNAFVALSWERKDLVAPARPAVSSCKPSSSSSSNFHHQNLTNNSIDKMAWRSSGSLSRSLISTLRPSSLRSTPSLPRLRPPPLPSRPGLQSRRFSFSPSRYFSNFLIYLFFKKRVTKLPVWFLRKKCSWNFWRCIWMLDSVAAFESWFFLLEIFHSRLL